MNGGHAVRQWRWTTHGETQRRQYFAGISRDLARQLMGVYSRGTGMLIIFVGMEVPEGGKMHLPICQFGSGGLLAGVEGLAAP